MNKHAAASLAKLLLVILALWMPVSTFAAAKTATSAAEAESPCAEPIAPDEAGETLPEESEAMHAPTFHARSAGLDATTFASENRARRLGERGKPPHQPPNPA